MIETLFPSDELDVVDSTNGVTREWIQSLPQELKDEALYRLSKVVEAKPTLSESFALNQVLYRTISGGTFTESADNVAERTGCDRKTILKGLEQAYNQNILSRNVRPGTSTEHDWKPVEEWKPEPERVVRNKDIRTEKVIEFPTTQNIQSVESELQLTSNQEVVHITDIRTKPPAEFPASQDTDETGIELQLSSNYEVVRIKDYSETDTPTIWRRTEDATRYCQIPPIHDQATGVEIQRQMDEEGLTAQKVVSRAVAFSKVPLMLLETLGAIGSKLVEGFSGVELGASEVSSSVPVNVENVIANLAGTMGRTTRDKSAPKFYGKDENQIEYFRDFELKECGVNLNDENLINVALAASSKDFEIATDCFLNWIAKQKTDDEGNVLKIDRFGNVQKTTATQKFINAINYKWKPHGYEEKVESEKLQNASAYSNAPASVLQSYSELIKSALTKPDGDFIRDARSEIISTCFSTGEFFGFEFIDRCKALVNEQARNQLMISICEMVKRFGVLWGVVINDDGQVVAV